MTAPGPEDAAWQAQFAARQARLMAAGLPATDLQALLQVVCDSLAPVFAHPLPSLGTHPALIPWLPQPVVHALFEKLVDSPARHWLFDDLEEVDYAVFARSQAKNAARLPGCPVAVLRSLASHTGKDVRKAVARHPACPSELLEALAEDVSDSVRVRVAAHPACPADALMRLARDPAPLVRAAVTRHPACPLSVLEALAADADAGVRGAVALSPRCPEPLRETVVDALVPLAVSNFELALQLAELARSADTSPPVLMRLAQAEDRNVRTAVARHAHCPPALLEQLSRDAEQTVRCAVAANPAVPGAVLAALAGDADFFIRWEVARHQPAEQGPAPALDALLTQLSEDEEAHVRASVASHPRCPVATLRQLATDAAEDVPREVATHQHCPAEVLDQLAQQGNRFALARQAANAACAGEDLARFARSEDGFVRRAVAGNPAASADLLAMLADDPDDWVRREVAGNPQTSAATLAMLANDPDLWVRRAVTRHPGCPTTLCEQIWHALLAADPTQARQAVLRSTGRPAWVLRALALDVQIEVRNSVYADRALPDEIRHHLRTLTRGLAHATAHARQSLTLDVCRYPACPPALPHLALLQPDCPPAQLAAGLQSSDRLLCLAAALNPKVKEAAALHAFSAPAA